MQLPVGSFIVAFLLATQPAFGQTQPSEPFGLSGLRIAFFSPQRAFSDSDDGKAGLARLKALDEKRGLEVARREIEDAFLARVRPVLEQVAKEKKLDVILNVDLPLLVWTDSSAAAWFTLLSWRADATLQSRQ